LSEEMRLVLVPNDELNEVGEAAGLSGEILEWLRGAGEETLTLPASHFE
jgi:hypothetical protein